MFVGLVRLADLVLLGMIERKFGRIIMVILVLGVIEPIPNLAILERHPPGTRRLGQEPRQ